MLIPLFYVDQAQTEQSLPTLTQLPSAAPQHREIHLSFTGAPQQQLHVRQLQPIPEKQFRVENTIFLVCCFWYYFNLI